MNNDFILRKHQQKILEYQAGKMGISAVPGSGKTFTLAYLAANLITTGILAEGQEILVVTLVNSAVDNFYQRVSSLVKSSGFMPNLGYRVRTLHGLAHDIIRERPDLAGLDTKFTIVDEREALKILDDCVLSWMRANPYVFDDYLSPDLSDSNRDFVNREQLPNLLQNIAGNFIRYAKDLCLLPEEISARLNDLPVPLPLAEFGAAVYTNYQHALAYRGAVDFDDLIRLSLQILEADEKLLKRLQRRWPFILEDEAQDSSRLQERILALLTGADGNWVRAGDPNQAIFETFTTANPKFLRDFFRNPQVNPQTLPTSSRSTLSVMEVANQLTKWSMEEHPSVEARDALQPPYIKPVDPQDSPQNPPDNPGGIHFIDRKLSPQEEIELVTRSLAKWLPDNPDKTIAVLAPRNQRAFEFVDSFRKLNLPVVDGLLRSTTTTRSSAGALANVLRYLAEPQSASKLATVYKVWRRMERDDQAVTMRNELAVETIRKCDHLEDFLYPQPQTDWLFDTGLEDTNSEVAELLGSFRQLVQRWHAAILLPIDQLVLTISQDLFTQPAELALAHKLAGLLHQARYMHPDWQLPELTEELTVIARNERRFIGFSEDDSGFDPNHYPGKIVVATMHKAKGLEWDRVYLTSLNNYDFPSGSSYDTYYSEKWYFRQRLNIEAEALAQLDALAEPSDVDWYTEGQATLKARQDYIRERLRLLYVGITRAKQELILSWNTGRRGEAQPALPFLKLYEYWQAYLASNKKKIWN